ncbi:hypothetical protein BGZ76_010241 [Entomortierella beljakovae]|nr:hypothetical protein BGZ76_010241 [Entomortierella beljakovae]
MYIFHVLLALSVSFSTINAQTPFIPTTTASASSVYIELGSLLINGGALSVNTATGIPNTLQQTFMIDLTTSWNVDNPAYKLLPFGPFGAIMSSFLSPNNQSWFVINNGVSFVFDIPTSKWSDGPKNSLFSQNPGQGTASDPESGMTYVPVADSVPTAAGSTKLLMMHITQVSIDSVSVQPFQTFIVNFMIAWSSALKSVLVIGGSPAFGVPGANNVTTTFTPASNTWGTIDLSTSATLPVPRTGSCFLPAYGGTKMILFGGVTRVGQFAALSDIFILDTATKRWIQGASAPDIERRQGSSCGFSNDQLIVWGGWDENYNIKKNATLIYNFKTNAWQTGYTAPASLPSPSTTKPGGSDQPNESSSSPPGVSETGTPTKGKPSIGVIIGPIVGILVIVIVVVVFMLRVRKRRKLLLAAGKQNGNENEKGDGNENSSQNIFNKYNKYFNGNKDNSNDKDSDDKNSSEDLSYSKKKLLNGFRAPAYPPTSHGTNYALYTSEHDKDRDDTTDNFTRRPYPMAIIPPNINQESGLEYNPSRQNSRRGNVHEGEYGSRHSQYPPNNNSTHEYPSRQGSRRGNVQEGDNGAMHYSYYSQHPQNIAKMEAGNDYSPSRQSSRRNAQEGEYGANRYSQHPHAEIPMEMPSRSINPSRTQRSIQRGPRNPQTSDEGSQENFSDVLNRNSQHPHQQQQMSQQTYNSSKSRNSGSAGTVGLTTDILDAYFIPPASPPLPPLPTNQY